MTEILRQEEEAGGDYAALVEQIFLWLLKSSLGFVLLDGFHCAVASRELRVVLGLEPPRVQLGEYVFLIFFELLRLLCHQVRVL